MITESFVLEGARAKVLAQHLIQENAFFSCTPLPFGLYEFVVKPDRVPAVVTWLKTHPHP